MVSHILLLMLVAAASVTDVTRHKIYNWNVYPGIVIGLLANGMEAVSENHSFWFGLTAGLKGFLACGFIMLICYVFFDMGGGDVKLIAMTGAFLGVEQGIEAMLWTFVLGSIAGAAILIWRIGVARLVTKTFHHLLLMLRARSWVPLTREEREPLKRWLFLAPSCLAAIAIVLSGMFK